jgi:hypothetical protein
MCYTNKNIDIRAPHSTLGTMGLISVPFENPNLKTNFVFKYPVPKFWVALCRSNA